ncbi:MAG TPA: hypothetical protein VHC43_13970 [Mycobacteriales bacterium]|nr:hypothetical protein [Mycobacteriales bacterium]
MSLDELIESAARRIRRYTPGEVAASDAAIVDIRSQDARERDGVIPGAHHIPRTVLEWRLASDDWRNTALDGRSLILSATTATRRSSPQPRSSSSAATPATSRRGAGMGPPD